MNHFKGSAFELGSLFKGTRDGNKNNEEKKESLQGLLIFFNISYYSCFTPFKIVWKPSTDQFQKGEFVLHQNGVYQIIYYIVAVSSFIGDIIFIRSMTAMSSSQNAKVYFDFATTFGAMLNQLMRVHIFRKHSQIFVKICNIYLHKKLVINLSNRSFFSSFLTPRRFTLIFLFLSFLAYSNGFIDLISSFMTFVDTHRDYSNSLVSPYILIGTVEKQVTIVEYVVLIYVSFCVQIVLFNYMMADAFFIFIICFYGQIVQEFIDGVGNDWDHQMVLEQLKVLQKLIHKMNLATQGFLLTAVFANLPYYVDKFPNFVDTPILAKNQIRHLFYCCYYFGGLFYCARQCKKLETRLKRWISRKENYVLMKDDQLHVFTFQLNCNYEMCLTLNGMYDINQRLFAAVVSAIITYSIIDIQFESQKESL